MILIGEEPKQALSGFLERFRFLCSASVAAVPDVIRAFVGLEESERRGDQRADLFERVGPRAAEERLQFRKRLFDRIEVGAVRRQKAEVRPDLLDRLAHRGLFVHGQIVEHDHVAWSQRGHQDLLDVRAKGVVVDRAIDHCRCGQLGGPQGRDHRVGLPVAAGRVIADARPAAAPGIATDQIGCHARFVDEDVLAGIVDRQGLVPLAARRRDIRATLFVGVYGFF
jgi:hypothetical protein